MSKGDACLGPLAQRLARGDPSGEMDGLVRCGKSAQRGEPALLHCDEANAIQGLPESVEAGRRLVPRCEWCVERQERLIPVGNFHRSPLLICHVYF